MVASETTTLRLEDVAQELFELITQFCIATPRGRRQSGDLKEIEFLSLAILQQHGTMIVGDIQRILGVLPAQMSRILRSLEDRERPLIGCQINPQDKRKIDVCMTPAGAKALADYEAARVRGITDVLRTMTYENQEDLGRLLEKLHGFLNRSGEALSH